MDIKEFEELIKRIDKNKYHIGRTISFDENKMPYISQWDIFRKNMSLEDYFDSKNLAILSSRYGNSWADIERFIEIEEEEND